MSLSQKAFILAAAILLQIVPQAIETRPVGADFQTRISAGKSKTTQRWIFERNANQVVHHRGERIDRWTKLGDREIALEQIYPREKLILEFAQGDLRAIGGGADWSSLTRLVDTNLLSKLKVTGGQKVFGYKGIRYRGVVQNASWEITWIPALDLPARIRRVDSKGAMETELKKLRPVMAVDHAATFARIDFADVGDMEYNEQLQRVLRHNPQLRSHNHKH